MSENKLLLTFYFEENSIIVNETVVDILKYPKQIQILINEEKHTLVLRACDIDDVSAIVIPPIKHNQFEISAKSLTKRLRKITGWADDKTRAVLGYYVQRYNVVIFSLDEAQLVQLQTMPIGR